MAGSTGMVWYDPGVVPGVQHLCFFRVCLAPLWLDGAVRHTTSWSCTGV
jgi:hypothetical protein